MNNIKYIDLFAGIGGFHYGLDRVNIRYKTEINRQNKDLQKYSSNSKRNNAQRPIFNCVYSNEYDKYANSVYRRHYGQCDNRDIREVKSNEIPDHDLLVGGFPCQSFSVAGKRRGFEDTRGTLFFEIARILQQKQPRLLLLENVKGLLSHESGETFRIILRTLDELGYDVQWQVLNSKNFGVPQNRERVFIIGHLRGKRRPEVFPFGQDDQEDIESRQVRTSATVSTRTGSTAGGQQFIKVAGTLDEGTWAKRNESTRRVYDPSGVAPTIPTASGGGVMPKIINPLNGKTQYGWHFEQNVFDDSGITRAVKSSEGSGNKLKVLSDTKIRRLTPTECERLQGFPDNWTKYGVDDEEISDTQRYKMCGNAVTTNVITAIGKLLKEDDNLERH